MGADGMYNRYVKRGLDVVLSFCCLLLLSPLFLILIILVFLTSGHPVFFRQERPGLHGRPFGMIKFRSMITETVDASGQPLSNDVRVTRIGRFLRKTSLDELPELINILVGDMSFVGPRPLLMKYLPCYTEEEMHRHDVRPGLTGYAQVKGRNRLTWRERFVYDVYYADHVSFRLDVKIFLKTIRKAVTGSGVADMQDVRTDAFGDYILYEGRKYRPLDEERRYEAYMAAQQQREANHE